ncbi:hypothetical protein [Acinetobacter pittii]|uniref:hypothetical protein n=1 Tax=Acinetobacter pittii TaxID=48296 RepID=UPI00300CCE33
MKVKELIEKLQEFDPELKVLIANEEEEIIGKNKLVQFFDIHNISPFNAETRRNENGEIDFKFTGMATKTSQEFISIDVTSQF